MQVQFESVTKEFTSKNGRVTAVDSLSINISSGRLIGFLGPSGCGKTTSLYLLAGIHILSNGKILFDGKDVSKLAPQKRGVGMVFQNYALYPHLTVRKNIAFPLENSPAIKREFKREMKEKINETGIKQSYKKFVEERVHEAAALVEIESLLDRKPAELSGGQQQRVAIARAIVKRPSILLLDEPLSNLDARLRIQTREEIRKIQRKTGITTIFVTHDQEEALNICDEIAILKQGVLQQYGEPQTVYDRPDNRFVAEFLGGTKINMLDGVIRERTLYLSDFPIRRNVTLPDGPIHIGVRPENILLSDEMDALSAIVLRVTRLGGAITVEAALSNGDTFRLQMGSGSTLKAGDTLRLKILPDSVCLFNQGGDKVWQG